MFKIPEVYDNVEQHERQTRLPMTSRIPQISLDSGIKLPRGTREIHRMRGEEHVHNTLLLKQFGIVAIHGGTLKHGHFEMMRNMVGYNLKDTKGFAIYRVDAPFKPVTRKGLGKKMGGGKGSIDHYETPIRAGRTILEIGGQLLWDEVRFWLENIAIKLPFEAIAVNDSLLDRLNEEEKRLEVINSNPYSMEWLIRNNILDCQRQLSPYDRKFFGKFVYRDRIWTKKWNQIRQSNYNHR